MELTPKEKAKELVEKFAKYSWHDETGFKDGSDKECALIAVDEILNAIDWHQFEAPNKQLEYWEQVKQEINNL